MCRTRAVAPGGVLKEVPEGIPKDVAAGKISWMNPINNWRNPRRNSMRNSKKNSWSNPRRTSWMHLRTNFWRNLRMNSWNNPVWNSRGNLGRTQKNLYNNSWKNIRRNLWTDFLKNFLWKSKRNFMRTCSELLWKLLEEFGENLLRNPSNMLDIRILWGNMIAIWM